ncbi:MAG: hypothetical protein HYV37_00295 [Candidatus Levyibacteriota bacterium]|nr:MAG: hypothetical protein HYV37_00295 [Candidatus Levybacteria bacterium]
MDISQEVNLIEKELLELILQHLENNKIDADKAQSLAKDFLAILPVADQKDLLQKLQNLSNIYEEAKELYVDELTKVSNEQRDLTLTQMRDAIQKGNIEHAITAAKSLQQNN